METQKLFPLVITAALTLWVAWIVFKSVRSGAAVWGPGRLGINAERKKDPKGFWSIVFLHCVGFFFFLWVTLRQI